jgi:predicted lipid-binding transport protein (Tim44 family)
MAADQRYCLNCGHRRGDPRVEFQRHLFAGDSASENGLARAPAGRGWNPLAAAALLGLLGIMLLVGVLIGKDENDEQAPSTAPPAQTTPTTGATAAPVTPPAVATPTTPATPPAATTPSTGQGAGGAAQPGGAPETEQGVPPAATKRGSP